jgi:putative alpha-1,2-mannosidase
LPLKKIFILLSVSFSFIVHAQTSQPAKFINPFIGASTSAAKAGIYHGLGKTFPGATTPYGAG